MQRTSGVMGLVASRRLGPLCLAQACGAFNDNLVKNAMVVLAIFKLGIGGAGLAALAGALFIAPYALLSATAGQLADRFDKSRLIRVMKVAEVVLMAAAAWAFAVGSVPGLLAVLFGLGVQATMFGPLKYGILPDHLREEELVAGNGLVEASTFLAILAGTVAGGALVLLGSPGTSRPPPARSRQP
ncbi:MAG TPA: MFS transporter, partial [Rhodopila sp.]|nr:MFS transporter [Rhodopila sp.]